MRPAEAQQALPECRFNVTSSSTLGSDDKRPRYDWISVSLGECKKVADQGEVTLSFFNDRLDTVFNYRADARSFVDRLAREPGWHPGPTPNSIRRGPATLVFHATDLSGRAYVAWEDECLSNERSAWINRYARGKTGDSCVAA